MPVGTKFNDIYELNFGPINLIHFNVVKTQLYSNKKYIKSSKSQYAIAPKEQIITKITL